MLGRPEDALLQRRDARFAVTRPVGPAGQLGDNADRAKEDVMEIRPQQPTVKGPADWFTGDVWIDSIVQPHDTPTAHGRSNSRVRMQITGYQDPRCPL